MTKCLSLVAIRVLDCIQDAEKVVHSMSSRIGPFFVFQAPITALSMSCTETGDAARSPFSKENEGAKGKDRAFLLLVAMPGAPSSVLAPVFKSELDKFTEVSDSSAHACPGILTADLVVPRLGRCDQLASEMKHKTERNTERVFFCVIDKETVKEVFPLRLQVHPSSGRSQCPAACAWLCRGLWAQLSSVFVSSLLGNALVPNSKHCYY